MITGDFDEVADRNQLPEDPEENRKMLLEWLTNRIDYMMEKDMPGLLALLYRIDVNEQQAKSLLAANEPGAGPGILAELIIQRQLEKARTRIAYRQSRKDTSIEDEEERW